MTLYSIDTIIEDSIFQDLKEVIKFFPEIEKELNSICLNLKQRFIDNGYDQIFSTVLENNELIQELYGRIERRDYDIDLLTSENSDLEARVYQLENENKSLESQVKDLQAEVYALYNTD